MSRSSEDRLIARFFAPLAGAGAFELKDDAACLTPRAGRDLVLTADALVSGVHFLPDDPPAGVARKALGVNVSDLAAKGADPVGFLLALALPVGWTDDWLASFSDGLGQAARDWHCPLLGGDTVKASGALTLCVTAIGEVPTGRMVRRAGARAGDRICVTGTIGDAALGLALQAAPPASGPAAGSGLTWPQHLTSTHRDRLIDRYRHPQPRIGFAPALREMAHAAMDVSDGLVGDLAKLCRASGVSAVIDAERVPLSDAARAALAADRSLLDRILAGGDDYEILCAVPESRMAGALAAALEVEVPLTVIGRVVEGFGPPAVRFQGAELSLPRGSFSHF